MNEDAPVNSAGDGSRIALPPAHIIVGKKNRSKYKKNNSASYDGRTKAGRKLVSRIMSGRNKKMAEESKIMDQFLFTNGNLLNDKNSQLILKIGEENKFENLMIKTLKCKNSEFDDNPEITAYLQVRDVTYKENDKVFVFNGWTFSSSPSLRPFEHPVYDIWLTKCY